ncbi:winged helix-turn-helix domain-containing protein [Pseudokineococcus basanitobsidens]|uniref:Winged helix-turn-helix domain-containing protein n=1 Tax=Pseudokineococcus basanitobsidens TaxID=1926649 RepID=A0ABU8RH60_9ACTN
MAEGTGAAGRPRAGLSRLRRPRLYEQLADHITAFIEAQGLSPGERLPPERLLAEQLGVSRATLAQALVALEVRGVVDVRHGEGAVLREAAAASDLEAALSAHGPDERDLADARTTVLAALVALAAERADEAVRSVLLATADEGAAQPTPAPRDVAAALVLAAAASPTLERLARALGAEPVLAAAPPQVWRAVAAGDVAAAREHGLALASRDEAPEVDVPRG